MYQSQLKIVLADWMYKMQTTLITHSVGIPRMEFPRDGWYVRPLTSLLFPHALPIKVRSSISVALCLKSSTLIN